MPEVPHSLMWTEVYQRFCSTGNTPTVLYLLINSILIGVVLIILGAIAFRRKYAYSLMHLQEVQAELQQTRNFLQTVIDHLPVAVFVKDGREEYFGEMRLWNQTSEKMFGLTAEQAIGKTVHDYFPKKQADFFLQKDREAFEWGTPEDIPEEPIDSYSLGRRILHTVKVPLYDEHQQPKYLLCFSEDITERKQAEVKLQNSEERLRLALMAANQGIYDLNVQTGEAIVSPEYAIMLGYDPETFHETNAQWIERLHPDDRENVARVYRAYVNGELPEYKVEFRQRIQNGDWKWILSLGKLVARDGLGQPLRMLGTHTDISDRKQAEAERLKAEKVCQELKLLENILEIILAGYWDYDIPKKQEYLSPGLKHMFGYTDDELPNSSATWKQLIFPEDLPAVLDNLEQHFQSHGEVPFYNEVRYRHKDGSTVWVICSGEVIEWDREGNPQRMIGCHINITQRKQSEELLRKSDAHLKTAQRIGKLGSWEFEIRTGKLTWSEEVFRLYGLDPATEPPTYAQLQQYFIHPDDWEHFNQTVQAAIASAQSYDMEHRLFRPDGTLVYIFTRGEMVYDSTGELTHIIGTALDITDRKLTEQKIQQTVTQLAATNQELESFSYSVSHDLRAPLRHIHGFVNALEQQLKNHAALSDPKITHYLQVIESSSEKMAQLIDGLLTLSRIGRKPMDYAPVHLRELVDEAIALVQGHLETKTPVEFVISELPTIQGDIILLRQVLTNLISNAVKFSRNTPDPRIEIGSLPKGTIFVRDNGVGFQMEYADKLFAAFQRLHAQTEFEGTGIGLAIVQRIIHRHGGTIWAESQLNQGATFYFTLTSSTPNPTDMDANSGNVITHIPLHS